MAKRTKQVAKRTLSKGRGGTLQTAISDGPSRLHYQELQILHEISQTILRSLDLETTLESILDKALPIGPFDLGIVRLLDPSAGILVPVASHGYTDPKNIQMHRKTARTVRDPIRGGFLVSREPRIEENVHGCQGLRTLKREGVQSVVIIPVRTEEEILGFLQLGSRTPRKFYPNQVHLLEAIGSQMGIAVQKARLYEQTQNHLHEIERSNLELKRSSLEQRALQDLLSNLLVLDLDEVLKRITEQAASLFQAEYAWLRLFDEEGKIRTRAVAGDEEVVKIMSNMGEEGRLVGRGKRMLDNRKPLAVQDMAQEDAPKPGRGISAGLHGFLGAPLFSRERKPLGVIHVMTRSPRDFAQRDLDLIEQFANGAAIAIENAGLFEKVKRKSQELAVLVEINRDVATLLDREILLPRIAEQARKILKVDSSIFRLLEGEELVLMGVSDPQNLSFRPRLRLTESLSGKIIQENRVLAIKNILEDTTMIEEHREVIRNAGYRSFLGVPLRVGERRIGALNFYSREEREFQPEEISLITAFADQAAIAIENANLYEESRRRAEIQELLKDLSQDITSLDIDSLLKKLTEQVRMILKVDVSDVRVVEKEIWRLIGVSGVEPELMRAYSKGTGRGRSKWIVENRKPLVIPDITQTTEFSGGESTRKAGIRGYLAVPLFSRGGEVIGILRALSCQPKEFTQDEVNLLQQLANGAAIALENARLFKETEKRASELSALHTVMSAVSASLELNEVLEKALHAALLVSGMEAGRISLLEGDPPRLNLKVHKGISPGHLEQLQRRTRHGPSSEQVLTTKRTVILDKHAQLPTEEGQSKTLLEGFTAAAWIPIIAKDRVVGIVNVATREAETFLREQIPLLEAIGASLGVAIENIRLIREAEQRAQEQAVLNSIAMAVSQSLHLDELLQISLNKVLEVTGRDWGHIRLKNPVTGELSLAAHRGISEDYVETLLHHRTPGGKTDRVFQSGEPLIINDPEAAPLKEESRREGIHSVAWIPLKARGKVVGILSVATGRPIPFTPREVELLQAIGNVIGVALENAQLFEDSERLVHELEATTDQLSAKNRELDSFVYTVSHDLKAPLISLEGMAALLLDEYGEKLDEGAQHYLKRLMAGSKQMEVLILDLLSLSRIGREGRPPEEVSLNQVADDLILEWGETIRAGGIHVTRHELPALWGVPTQIQQVMTNLLSNAVKYLGDPADPMIEIGAKDGGGKTVECYVKDNGIGIDPQYHEKVFETFQRLKEIETEGTGVGLAIVKKIVEGAGGRIWVESAKGEGAVFRFTWPKRQTEVRS